MLQLKLPQEICQSIISIVLDQSQMAPPPSEWINAWMSVSELSIADASRLLVLVIEDCEEVEWAL